MNGFRFDREDLDQLPEPWEAKDRLPKTSQVATQTQIQTQLQLQMQIQIQTQIHIQIPFII